MGKKRIFIPGVFIACLMLVFVSYNSWDKNHFTQQDSLSCVTIKPEQIVRSVERDLLDMPANDFFNKTHIVIGALTFEKKAMQLEEDRRYSLPFTLSGRMIKKYVAYVSCADLHDITYEKRE